MIPATAHPPVTVFIDRRNLVFGPDHVDDIRAEGLEIVDDAQTADWVVVSREHQIERQIGRARRVLAVTPEPYFITGWPRHSIVDGTAVHVLTMWTTGARDLVPFFLDLGRYEFLDPAEGERHGAAMLAESRSDDSDPAVVENLKPLRHRIASAGHERALLDVYGKGWEKHGIEVVAEHRSPVEVDWHALKHIVLSRYRVNVCLENCHVEGYVSEKLWHAIRAGCVPVYYGSSWLDEMLPPGDYIDLRDHDSVDSLLAAIEGISETDAIARVTRLQAELRRIEREHDVEGAASRVHRAWIHQAAQTMRAAMSQERHAQSTWSGGDEPMLVRQSGLLPR